MTKILLIGANGKMGHVLTDTVKNSSEYKITAGFDNKTVQYDCFKIYNNFSSVPTDFDVVLDFSNPLLTSQVCEFCENNKKPLIIATTGLSEEQHKQLKKLSESVAVFVSSNMSYGVFVMTKLLEAAKQLLDGWEIEIVEKHHTQKIDAPSGTALMLAEVLKKPETEISEGRSTAGGKRKPNQIGIHSVRGGTVVGEHEVGFYGSEEIITINHSAQSKRIFAFGALKACAFTKNAKAGLYKMEDLI